MLVGTTGGTENRLDLKLDNPLFYFDGSYLIQVNLDSKVATGDVAYIGAASGSATYVDGGTTIDVSTKEDKSNKVTSLSSSSTDTQYPSAKCVYDLLGDIETLINAL